MDGREIVGFNLLHHGDTHAFDFVGTGAIEGLIAMDDGKELLVAEVTHGQTGDVSPSDIFALRVDDINRGDELVSPAPHRAKLLKGAFCGAWFAQNFSVELHELVAADDNRPSIAQALRFHAGEFLGQCAWSQCRVFLGFFVDPRFFCFESETQTRKKLAPIGGSARKNDGRSLRHENLLKILQVLPPSIRAVSQRRCQASQVVVALRGMKETPRLADVAFDERLELQTPLAWVGMSEIEMPVRLKLGGAEFMQAARLEAFVNLDKAGARGIHMSRLYLLAQDALTENALTSKALADLLKKFLSSHEGLSTSARLKVSAELPVKRAALKSANSAWRTYPVKWIAESQGGRTHLDVEVLITYSSTCPASAALSRQLIQENFARSFAGRELNYADLHGWLGTSQGINATPHAQRSEARVRVRVPLEHEVDVVALIDLLETALATPVQAAVKREDEQEFALRNGQNLMFCEDAARRVGAALMAQPEFSDFVARVQHIESLHPHNAVAMIRKPGGSDALGFD